MVFKKKIVEHLRLSVLIITAVLLVFLAPAQKAQAIPVVELGGNLVANIVSQIQSIINTASTTVMKINDIQRYAWDKMNQYMLPALKASSIRAVNSAVTSAIGQGNKGKAQFVTDWKDYLYQQPQKEATSYMNTFFESTLSSSSTKTVAEGVQTSSSGSATANYSDYMKQQAQDAYKGTSTGCKMDFQSYAKNPKQMFEDQSFRGFMAFMEPCNNPYSYSEIAKVQYDNQLAIKKDIAKSQQSNGWLPKFDKTTGAVSAPSTLYQNAMEQASQLANQAVVNAQSYADLVSSAVIKLGGSNANFKF